MPILNSVAQAAAKPFLRVISPRSHAIADYINAGIFLMTAGLFWRRNKRASVAAMVGGGAALALNLLTDYPGGEKKVISFRTHREIDFGLAAMVSTLPEFFAFKDDAERKFFLAEGAFISALAELTQCPRKGWVERQARVA